MILIGGYDLSGGTANWTSTDLTDYSFFFLNIIWSNVTGSGTLFIRETDGTEFFEIQSVTLTGAESYTEINNIIVTRKYLDVKFVGTATGRLSIELEANKNKLQTHDSDFDSHEQLKRYTLLNG